IMTAVERCLEHRRMARENFLLRRQVSVYAPLDGMVGRSEAMNEVYDMITRVAPTSSIVLIEGETGSGKELVARAVHKHSARSGAFVPLNCGSVSPDLLESELFGHVKGAFTGAQSSRDGLFTYAHDGTLFLDEISEMQLPLQAKLLRVLDQHTVRPVGSDQEMPVNARVLAATNRCLEDEVGAANFREDLYDRLNVLRIVVPPLRERRDDIPELAHYFSNALAATMGIEPIPFEHADLVRMQQYRWPGNVRELRNVIERWLLLGKLPNDCCVESQEPDSPAASAAYARDEPPANWTLADVEKHHILRVLEAAGGNKSEAARRLGVSRKTLERKLALWRESTAA
ncbi:MAG: sigma-54 interaction domain-containing protein, partial [Gammaproteobacteria bacterium]